MALLSYISPEELQAALSTVIERLDSLHATIDDLEERLDRIENPPVYIPPPDPVIVTPADDLQLIINMTTEPIHLEDGVYPPVTVREGTTLKAVKPDGKVYISGFVKWSEGWEPVLDTWVKPFTKPLYQHPAHQVNGGAENPSERGMGHRRAMQPHILMFNGIQMLPVYNKADLVPGRFWLEGTAAEPIAIHAIFLNDANPAEHSVLTSYSEFIIKGENDSVSNVTLEGLTLIGCANTQTRGALHFPKDSKGWTVNNCVVDNSSGEGVVLRGSGHLVELLTSTNHGISAIASNGLNDSVLRNIEGSFSGFKPDLDVLWHGGNKFTNSSNNHITGFVASGMDAAGLWLDISNKDNIIDGFTVDGAKGFGVHLEHWTLGTSKHSAKLINGTIKNVKKYLGIGSGLQVQSNVSNYLIRHVVIQNCEDGAVYYKKEERRGKSGHNTFDDIEYSGNGNDNRWAIQGDLNDMPDEYINMVLPEFTNWPYT